MAKIELSEWAKENLITKKGVRLLRRTIDKKWIPIVNEKGVDNGNENCHLCRNFQGQGCSGCPIKRETGRSGCKETPYDDWNSHHCMEHHKVVAAFPRKVECPECKEIAQKEVDWLEALYKKCIKVG